MMVFFQIGLFFQSFLIVFLLCQFPIFSWFLVRCLYYIVLFHTICFGVDARFIFFIFHYYFPCRDFMSIFWFFLNCILDIVVTNSCFFLGLF